MNLFIMMYLNYVSLQHLFKGVNDTSRKVVIVGELCEILRVKQFHANLACVIWLYA